MDSSSSAAEMVTLCAASGYAVHFFTSGQGNVIGNPVLPVIKLCANPRTANGRLTAVEALGHRELVMTRLCESASWGAVAPGTRPITARGSHGNGQRSLSLSALIFGLFFLRVRVGGPRDMKPWLGSCASCRCR